MGCKTGLTGRCVVPLLRLAVWAAGGVEEPGYGALRASIRDAVGLELHEVEALLANAVGHDCPVLGFRLADDLACTSVGTLSGRTWSLRCQPATEPPEGCLAELR